MKSTRRDFLKLTAIGGAGFIGCANVYGFSQGRRVSPDELTLLSAELLQTWVDALLKLQIVDKASPDYGALMCPACGFVHGRVADSIYPLLYMAHKKKQSKYLDAAVLLYRWMEKTVSQPDGSWMNDSAPGSWKGITIFTIIALCESLKYHGSLLDKSLRIEIENRLKKACDFIYDNFSINYGNINYPIAASYGLALAGTILNIPKYKEKGRAFAHETLGFLTKNNRLIHGEGGPYDKSSEKGCFSVDLGYNVEESLPSLVLYSKLTNDKEVLDAIIPSMQAHMEFMLPDGAWDNSWGTRNFKWTYWGSRTSDGCQPAYALMAEHDPRFYRVALKNTGLLRATTHNGLLYGGPHYVSHNVLPCVHHTFCHAKALAAILDHGIHGPAIGKEKAELPREIEYGGRFMQDIQSWLISVGSFRATVTGYDREYGMKNGHATGGALSLLWHQKTGPLLSASMNEYQLKEKRNMQPDTDPNSMPLTPRIELTEDGILYMNICDLKATVEAKEKEKDWIVTAHAKLVDKDQLSPKSGEISCTIVYTFKNNKVILDFSVDAPTNKEVRIVFPVISNSTEKFDTDSKQIKIYKKNARVYISSSGNMELLPTTNGRIFNFVPGLEAIPFAVNDSKCRIELEVEELITN